jgi:hypothetical protein
MKHKNDIGKVLKNRLGELNESPDMEVWNTLESELKIHKRNRIIKRIAFVLTFLICLYILYVVIDKKKEIPSGNTIENTVYNHNTTIIKQNSTETYNEHKLVLENQKITNETNLKPEPLNDKIDNNRSNNKSINSTQKKEFKNLSKKISSPKNNYDSIQKNFAKNALTKKLNRKDSLIKKLTTIRKHNAINSSMNFRVHDYNQQITLKEFDNRSSKSDKHFNNTKEEITRTKSKVNPSEKHHEYLKLKSKGYYQFQLSTILNDSLILKTNSKDSIKKTSSRWSISVNGGINQINTNLKENIIHNNLIDTKNNSTTESYGIRLNYQLNKKFSLRFGLQKLSFRFNTSNIANTNPNIRIDSIVNTKNVIPLISTSDLITKLNNSSSFELNEMSNYLEFPLEIKYRLPKLENISLIAGASYLHLLNSDIYVNSNNGNQFKLAKSLDARKSVYSLNFGVGYDIRLSKNFYLNLEGFYKQYLGLYDSNGTNFSTHNLNFQAGFTFKF